MRFAERGLYVEAYVKCANCGVLVYDSERQAPVAGEVYCSSWCRDWAAQRAARRAREAAAGCESKERSMASRRDLIRALLKGIETGDPASVAVVDEERYIQHNPQTQEGSEGLAALFERLSKTSPRVNVVRAFEDGDYVFAHTEYDFARSNIGFEVFRFEADRAVEHWDNIQRRQGPNLSGHSMVDGPVEATDLDRTEANREMVRAFVEEVIVGGQLEALERYVDGERYVEHNPRIGDGLPALRTALAEISPAGVEVVRYDRVHRLLAEGSFVLSVSEGAFSGVHSSFYDLFRVADGKIVEHWDTTEAIPPRAEWKNDNGKF